MKTFTVPDSLVARQYQENLDLSGCRSSFMRDRDRVLYATAFRRLDGKTQIYTVGLDDHKRNRLTHTLEVAQIARTISRELKLNEDLTEAIALAHDFGHTPFGHAGEEALHELMIPKSQGIKESPYNCGLKAIRKDFKKDCPSKSKLLSYAFGFKHNLQSVRVAVTLEDSYRDKEGQNIGLNLTNVTLYGIMAHASEKYKETDAYPNYQKQYVENYCFQGTKIPAWSFEALVVERADEIAQWHHDLEDALRSNALHKKDIIETIKKGLGKSLKSKDRAILKEVTKKKFLDRSDLAKIAHVVVGTLVTDLTAQSKKNFNFLRKKTSKIGEEQFFKEYEDLGFKKTKEK